MIEKIKEKFKKMKRYEKIITCIVIFAGLILLKLFFKIGINYLFIANYPLKNQEYRLKLISFLNLYQPYVAPYNYGNYYYQKEQYNEAYDKYIKALSYSMPQEKRCSVAINTGLTLIKLSESENNSNLAYNLLNEAQTYLKLCPSTGGSGGGSDGAAELNDTINQLKSNISQNNQQTNTTLPTIDDIQNDANTGSDKRDQTFQEQSYNNQGQYGQDTPGSGCIGACW